MKRSKSLETESSSSGAISLTSPNCLVSLLVACWKRERYLEITLLRCFLRHSRWMNERMYAAELGLRASYIPASFPGAIVRRASLHDDDPDPVSAGIAC